MAALNLFPVGAQFNQRQKFLAATRARVTLTLLIPGGQHHLGAPPIAHLHVLHYLLIHLCLSHTPNHHNDRQQDEKYRTDSGPSLA